MADYTYRIVIPMRRDAGEARVIKGQIFERLIGLFLANQSYIVRQRVRDAGTEIDLICESRISGEKVIVECKAQEKILGSSVINKLFTDAVLHKCNAAIIFSANQIGAEAKTRLEQLCQNYKEIKFRFYSSNDIINFLIESKKLTLPAQHSNRVISHEWNLILFEHRQIWSAIVLDSKIGSPIGPLAWDAINGRPIDPHNAPDLSETDFFHADLAWLEHDGASSSNPDDSQPVIEVIPGEEWSDYRPSRPEDFVGRTSIIDDIRRFFNAIKSSKTSSRIFGIKGRSGWGKSSLAIKLARELAKDNIYVLPVDCRAAVSSYYGDMAIAKALMASAIDLYDIPLFKPEFEFRSNPFEDLSVSSYLREVKSANGLVVIIFDQFEAIIHRSELRATLERMKHLAFCIDDFRGSVAVGFSWKTDGAVSSDNPGYHIWHSLSDRRKDFEIDLFSREDADQFIKLATAGTHAKLPSTVTQFVLEQYGGLPWLLKKLVKHCLDDIRKTGSTVNLRSFFNAAALFEGDLQELTGGEMAVLSFIAKEGPVEIHVVEDRFSSDRILTLIDRRLLIKSGSQISVYWDIFRDYILEKKVPQIPNTYIPTISVRKFRSVIRLLILQKENTYDALAERLGISYNTADNAVRDLVNIGLADTSRIFGEFTSRYDSSKEATTCVIVFLKSHAVFNRVNSIIDASGSATISEIEEACRKDFEFISIDSKTLRTYIRKILVYCLDFRLLLRDNGMFKLGTPCSDILYTTQRIEILTEDSYFRGAAPPQRVIDLLLKIRNGECGTIQQANDNKLRNAVHAASRLGIIEVRNGLINPLIDLENDDINQIVSEQARRLEPLCTMIRDLNVENLSSEELGSYLSDALELNWSTSSCARYGHSLRLWGMWLSKN